MNKFNYQITDDFDNSFILNISKPIEFYIEEYHCAMKYFDYTK